eukprot:gnl/MRDRNA2_/MRDRNA2_245777_c0_seq1.p2 gnl/MRDRNA2_/MRDRNA2_245777_c0~~gnl/MRDRNA2_/MRDRNA2_245777_c0_seq1.p2  ORF type:complete len:109 (+),score=18.80 gnl/MRDRNA2_/MRDRNA2_245777_c0_seq1:558-884(+)
MDESCGTPLTDALTMLTALAICAMDVAMLATALAKITNPGMREEPMANSKRASDEEDENKKRNKDQQEMTTSSKKAKSETHMARVRDKQKRSKKPRSDRQVTNKLRTS